MLSTANVSAGQRLTPEDLCPGGPSGVVADVIDDDVVIDGELPVDAAAVVARDPGKVQHRRTALSEMVEDRKPATDGRITPSADVYVRAHEHGPLDATLREAQETFNRLRTQCLEWLRSRPAG